jgi:hypothetical protein
MPQHPLSELVMLRARLAGYAFEVSAIRLQLLLRRANFNPDQPRIPAGQPGGGQWTSEGGAGGGDSGSEGRDQRRDTRTNQPIRLAQVGGASAMTDTGSDRSPPVLGAYLQAPAGRTISTFTVSPLTNNVYPTPLGPVDVTGWTAYYGPPGTRLRSTAGEDRQTYPDGVLRFVNPSEAEAHTRPVAPGI